MKKKRVLASLLVAGIITSMLGGTVMASETEEGHAGISQETVLNERWGKPTFVAGAGLDDEQVNQTLSIFDYHSLDDVLYLRATGEDLVKYLGYGSGDDASMISSVMVNRENEGKGIEVEILTPDNITSISEDQYKNPLVTAGITDATVKVAAIRKVTGESALSGVYKAFEENGEAVDPERAQLAQEELEVTTDVSVNLIEGVEDEDEIESLKAQLNQALTDIKLELAELKKQQDKQITKEDVEEAVNIALKKNELDSKLSEEDVAKLVSLAEKYDTVDGVLSQETLEQLKELSKGFQEKLSGLGEKASELAEEGANWFSRAWTSIKNFFSGLINK